MTHLDLVQTSRLSAAADLLTRLEHGTDPLTLLEGFAVCMRPGGGQRGYIEIESMEDGSYALRRARGLPPYWPTEPLRGGVLGQLVASPVPRIIHNPDRDAALGQWLTGYRCAAAVPLFVDGRPKHWAVLLDSEPGGLTSDDLQELLIRTALVSAAITNLRVERQLFAANLKVQEDIQAIARIQKSLIPQSLPNVARMELAASYDMVAHAGGDLYDVLPLGGDDPRFAILIGDVAGHGPAAAIVMAMLSSILHACPDRGRGPGHVLSHLNRNLCGKSIGSAFTTAFLAFFDPTTLGLTYARAGHPAPILTRDAKHIHLDAVGDLPLGIDPDAFYDEKTIPLLPRDTLVFYTDGITETRNALGQFFAHGGIERSLPTTPAPPETLIHRILTALDRHAPDAPAADDRTLLTARVS